MRSEEDMQKNDDFLCFPNFNNILVMSQECLKQKTSGDQNELRNSCVYDLCHVEDGLNDEVCRYAEILAWDCSDNEKINVSGWQSKVPACSGQHLIIYFN